MSDEKEVNLMRLKGSPSVSVRRRNTPITMNATKNSADAGLHAKAGSITRGKFSVVRSSNLRGIENTVHYRRPPTLRQKHHICIAVFSSVEK